MNNGENLGISEIIKVLKTFKNWKVEIANYHQYRFTNAVVEGKNNEIKALQRRSYFLRNRQSYEYRIYLECNNESEIKRAEANPKDKMALIFK
ncbi:transposase [Cellulosilyticum ruminicola]|uniref:transposase n=1 Tax=Cellulosilyticum ruminicola TaxID=425254 RepID=UPI0009F9BC6A